jgi:hypothetical protein
MPIDLFVGSRIVAGQGEIVEPSVSIAEVESMATFALALRASSHAMGCIIQANDRKSTNTSDE